MTTNREELLRMCADTIAVYEAMGDFESSDYKIAIALRTLLTQPPAVDGWKLVPIEPTKEMLDAAWKAKQTTTIESRKNIYCSMLAAAPSPQPAEPVVNPEALREWMTPNYLQPGTLATPQPAAVTEGDEVRRLREPVYYMDDAGDVLSAEEWHNSDDRTKDWYSIPLVPVEREGDDVRMVEVPGLQNPTAIDLTDPLFNAIWNVVKDWDVGIPSKHAGHTGATGSHVMLILNAIRKALSPEREGGTK